MTRVIVTGGAGFIGHHLVSYLLDNTDWHVCVLDKLTYASEGLRRFEDAGIKNSPRVSIFTWDLACPLSVGLKKELGKIEYIFHLAAESHVPNSIASPVEFVKNNVDSTLYMLEYARELGSDLKRFLYMSTDEVFGDAPEGTSYKENDQQDPRNPYSASKAAGEMVAMSYFNTYNLPLVIFRSMNVAGVRQANEKFMGICMRKILAGETIMIHSKDGVAGERNYIHSFDVCAGIFFVMTNGVNGESYHISGERDCSNLEMAQMIAKYMKMELKYEMVRFDASRPGFDFRYSLDGSKLSAMGWKVTISLEDTIKEIVEYSMANRQWLE